MTLGSLRGYDANCNENVALKLHFASSSVFCDYSMLGTVYKIGGVHFRLLGTICFYIKAKNDRFTAASSRCRKNLKYENFTSSFGRLRQNIAPNSVPHVPHDYFSSFNQSNHWFVALSLTLPSSNLKLPIVSKKGNKPVMLGKRYYRSLRDEFRWKEETSRNSWEPSRSFSTSKQASHDIASDNTTCDAEFQMFCCNKDKKKTKIFFF